MSDESNRYINWTVITLAVTAAALVIYANAKIVIKYHGASTLDRERCYGVAAAGKNDCATAKHSCATQSVKDKDPSEWIMVPKGLCERIKGKLNGG